MAGSQGGAPSRIRTYDLRIRSPLLYPAELWAHSGCNYTPAWQNKEAALLTAAASCWLVMGDDAYTLAQVLVEPLSIGGGKVHASVAAVGLVAGATERCLPWRIV